MSHTGAQYNKTKKYIKFTPLSADPRPLQCTLVTEHICAPSSHFTTAAAPRTATHLATAGVENCEKVLTEVSSDEATQMTSTSRSITTPRAIRLRWAAELP